MLQTFNRKVVRFLGRPFSSLNRFRRTFLELFGPGVGQS